MAAGKTLDGRMRVAVVDDDADTCIWFKDVLQSETTLEFVGEFSSARAVLTAMPCLQPDLVLLDIKLPDMDGVECTRSLRQLMAHLRVVIVSGNREAEWFDRSFEAGAVAYLIKPLAAAQLIATLRFIARSMNETIGRPPKKSEAGPTSALNKRERYVLSKLAEGLLYKEIADALGISYAALHKSQHNVFKKLHVSNRSEAIRAWLRNGGN